MSEGCYMISGSGLAPFGPTNQQAQSNPFKRDEDYTLLTPPQSGNKGTQCGVCGMKFDYGVSYGYYCGRNNCPCFPR